MSSVYKPGTTLVQMLEDSVCRDLDNDQILSEINSSGFIIDDSIISYFRRDLDRRMVEFFELNKKK